MYLSIVFSLLIGNITEPIPDQSDNIFVGYKKGLPLLFTASRIPGYDLDNKELYLREDAAQAWKKMMIHAFHEGIILQPTYAFREHYIQMQVRRRNPRLAAKPGYSPHQSGVAVDIAHTTKRVNRKTIKTNIYYWLAKNAAQFGFYQTIPKESWHWEYKKE